MLKSGVGRKQETEEGQELSGIVGDKEVIFE
jgi:hypothetical protein